MQVEFTAFPTQTEEFEQTLLAYAQGAVEEHSSPGRPSAVQELFTQATKGPIPTH